MGERDRLNDQKLSDEDTDLLYDIVDITTKILTKNNIKYSIEGGTLLGVVRCGGLLPHDNDADIDILKSDGEKVLKLRDEFDKYDLELILTPGWGMQVSWKYSPELKPNLWTDGINEWSSKWPFLDLIYIDQKENGDYHCSEDVAQHDYPQYLVTKDQWNSEFETVTFGHLKVQSIQYREKYLDYNYPEWRSKIIMIMDHRKNIYFETPIVIPIQPIDLIYRSRSKTLSKLL